MSSSEDSASSERAGVDDRDTRDDRRSDPSEPSRDGADSSRTSSKSDPVSGSARSESASASRSGTSEPASDTDIDTDCASDFDSDSTFGSVSSESVSTPSDAFQVLGNEIRMGILETMLERADGDGSSRMRFSELFETTDLETTAQFAYHLEQLVGPYLRKVPESGSDSESHSNGNSSADSNSGSSSKSASNSTSTSADGRTGAGYELTYAGLKIARAIATGAYTRRVDHPPIALEDPCPFCETDGLEASSTDNVIEMECTACERSLLRLQFPPAGLEAHGDRLPEAFDRHYRHRLALMRDGVCPECSGSIEATLVSVSDAATGDDGESNEGAEFDTVEDAETDTVEDATVDRLQAAFECAQCGHELQCPVTLSLLEHPAVVSFYRDHGRSIRDRPIWNVGHEWAEALLSREPVCVRVVTELEDDVLALYVDASLRVVDVQRTASPKASARPRASASGSASASTSGEGEARDDGDQHLD